MGSSKTDHAKKRKSKKRRKKEADDVAIPFTLIPRSTSNTVPCSTTTKICFWGIDRFEKETSWFVVDIPKDFKRKPLTDEMYELAAFDHRILHPHTNKRAKQTPLTPLFSLGDRNSPIPLINNTYATLGSFVYSFGGTYEYPKCGDEIDSKIVGSNLVFYFDINDKYGNYRWKQAPSMITYRRNPQVITVDCKLYVFGCNGEEFCNHITECSIWAEVFDPSTNEWSSLPVPEFNSCLFVCSPNHMKKNRIAKKIAVLLDDKFVYELDIETKSWEHIGTLGPNLGAYITEHVLVDGVFYWFANNANNAKAYDMVKDEYFEGPVQDYSLRRAMNEVSERFLETYDLEDICKTRTKVLHLGKRYFCVLAYLNDLDENSSRIHCVFIKMSKTKELCDYRETRSDARKFFLRARILSCHTFPIDRELLLLDGRIM